MHWVACRAETNACQLAGSQAATFGLCMHTQLVIAAASSQRAGLVVAGKPPLGYVCLLSGAHTGQGDAQEADLPAADGQQLVATCCVRAGSTVHKGCTDCWFASQSWLRTVICILAAPERWCCILLAELAHSQMQDPPATSAPASCHRTPRHQNA